MAKNKPLFTEPNAISYLRMCKYKMNTYDLKNNEHEQSKNVTYENNIYVLENG